MENSATEFSPDVGKATSARFSLWASIRLVLAFVATLALLPYAFGRSLIATLFVGSPESTYVGMLVVGLLAVMGLNYGLSSRFSGPRTNRRVAVTIAVCWVAMIAAIIFSSAGSMISRWLVLAGFLPATLCVVWLGWMFYYPFRWRTRGFVLGGLLVPLVLFIAIYQVEGLSGDAKVNFVWRWQQSPSEAISVESPEQEIELATTGVGDFPQYLGPGRNAVLPGIRLARDWESHPPQELWRRPVGAGWGSFAVVGSYAFTQEQRGSQECVVCYHLATGDEAWVHSDPERFDNTLGGPGPRATPTLHAGRVYSVGATGLLNCLDGNTGDSIWSVNIVADNSGQINMHGVCASPLIVDDLVVVAPTGASKSSLAAYDQSTGNRVWAAGRHPASYGSPMLAELAGTRQILIFNTQGVTAHDTTTGNVLWDVALTNGERVNCSQPVLHAGAPDRILVSTGYGGGSALYRIDHLTDRDWTSEAVWKSRTMKTKFTTAVAIGEYVYGLDNGILQCVELATGKSVWKRGRYGHGQILLVGDLLFVQAEDGNVVLVEPGPEGLVELGSLPALDRKTWNCPAVVSSDSEGSAHLLVRNDREAACYRLPMTEAGGETSPSKDDRSLKPRAS